MIENPIISLQITKQSVVNYSTLLNIETDDHINEKLSQIANKAENIVILISDTSEHALMAGIKAS